MTEASASLTSGFLLTGRYAIEKELGRGGVGVVYLARDEQLHSRPVVVKLLLEEAYRDDWIKTKFLQEMEALSRLDHPGIVNLLDTGDTPDGRPFLVMQYVEGVSLRTILRPEGMELDRAARLIRQIGEALTAAHEKGVLHRDLKPENIMIQSPGVGEQVKIIDFGLAKVLRSSVAESTAVPNVAGSFSYMAPEQLMARPVTAASDIFALGVIVYEMLTGRRPHNPDSLFQLLDMLRAGVHVTPHDLRPSIPNSVDPLVLQALSFESSKRPESAASFGSQLEQTLQRAGTTAKLTQLYRPAEASRLLALLAIAALTASAVLLARQSLFRFDGWDFLFRPHVLLAGAAWMVLALVASRRSRWFRPFAAAMIFVASAVMLGTALLPASVIQAELAQGTPNIRDCCSLQYSDPRGFRYTIQENSYYRIRIKPDRWNKISEYELQVKLPPELEFADIYLDHGFAFETPLTLEPSPTHDVLVLRRSGDSFNSTRYVVFTTKHRNTPAAARIQVVLRTPGATITHEF